MVLSISASIHLIAYQSTGLIDFVPISPDIQTEAVSRTGKPCLRAAYRTLSYLIVPYCTIESQDSFRGTDIWPQNHRCTEP